MDPYIEACGLWEDFHIRLTAKIANALSPALPDNYFARTAVRTYFEVAETDEERETAFPPGIRIATLPGDRYTPAPGGTGPIWPGTEPVSMRPFVAAQYKEPFVEIYELHPERRRLVTCIEVLSPPNKRKGTTGWNLYSRKRQKLLLGKASLVEIDLLRGGSKMPMLDPWPNSPYTLLVCRRSGAPYCRVWPAHFRRPLPPIPVPLSSPDSDVTLDLQPLVEAIYAQSRYYKCIDYSKPLRPPLSAEESAWLQAQLQARSAQE
jgi:hypothetical protein